jgi:hypothetical protein
MRVCAKRPVQLSASSATSHEVRLEWNGTGAAYTLERTIGTDWTPLPCVSEAKLTLGTRCRPLWLARSDDRSDWKTRGASRLADASAALSFAVNDRLYIVYQSRGEAGKMPPGVALWREWCSQTHLARDGNATSLAYRIAHPSPGDS